MKNLLTIFLSLLSLTCLSQELELEFAHRFGVIENNIGSAIGCVKYYEDIDQYLVAGVFGGSVDVGINTSTIINTSGGSNGFVAIYDSNFDLLHYFNTDAGIISAELMGDRVVTCGRFGAIDVDLNDDQNEIIESLSNSGNGYIATYDLEGNYMWHKIFSSEVGNLFYSCSSYQDNIYLTHSFSTNSEDESLTFSDGSDDISLFNENGTSCLLLCYNSNGEYQFHHHYKSDEDNILPFDFEIFGNKLYLSLNVRQGTFDVGLTSPVEFEFERFSNSIVLGYQLTDLNLVEYYCFSPANDESITGAAKLSKTNEQSILISTMRSIGQIESYNHINTIPATISNNNIEFQYSLIYSYNNDDNSILQASLMTNDFFRLNNCSKLDNQDLILSIEYEGELFRNDQLVEGQPDEMDRTYALIYLNDQLNGAELFNYGSSSQSELDHDILINPSPGKLLVAGNYEGNHDVDFSENSQNLGNVLDDLNGFISSYNFDPESSVTEITENNFKLYPNPAHSHIKIEMINESFKNSNYSIYNMQGKKINQGVLTSKAIDISKLEEGTYRLVIGNYYSMAFIKL